MCSYGRCPESMWLFNNSWHNNTSLELKRDYELDEDYKIKPIENNHSTERVHFADRKSIKSDVVSTSDKRSAPTVVANKYTKTGDTYNSQASSPN